MSVDFDAGRWERVKDNYRRWWAGELKRPLIDIVVPGREPGRPAPALPVHDFVPFYGPSVSEAAIVDRWDYDLSRLHFLGDSFPMVRPNCGPGVIAEFLGAPISSDPIAGTVWFHPPRDLPAAPTLREVGATLQAGVSAPELNLTLDPHSLWRRRIGALYRQGLERWEGRVLMGMTDLGGNLDIVSSFLPGEKLLLALTDHPADVKRLTWQAHQHWWTCFDEFNRQLSPLNPGYSSWARIYSEEPYYMLQCDFCYMIGPDMFEEFVKPELAASCRRLKNAFYHLDGPGELPHLDHLLGIPELKGIQWIPGAGNPDMRHWPQVYRRIRDAGKLIQLFGKVEVLDAVVGQLGSPEGIVICTYCENLGEARAFLEKYKAL